MYQQSHTLLQNAHNNNNNNYTIFIVLSSMAPAICESSLWFIWAKVGQRQVAANS